MFRPRTLAYATVLLAIIGAAAGSLVLRNPLKVDVIRDRGALAREAGPGVIENVYRLQLMNTDETPRKFTIRAEGLPGLAVVGIEQPVALGAAETLPVAVRLRAALGAPGTHKVEFVVQAVEDEKVVRHEPSSFIIPR